MGSRQVAKADGRQVNGITGGLIKKIPLLG